MNVEHINPFLESVNNVLPQLGFSSIKKESISLEKKVMKKSGVVLMLGIVGDLEGSVAYCLETDTAKSIASTMMMGQPVEELDEMAKSALSELSNMLTANAGINFSQNDISVNISPPTLMYGNEFEINMNKEKVISIKMNVDGHLLEINISVI